MTSSLKSFLLFSCLATFMTACEEQSLDIGGNAESGKKLFKRTCQTCHVLEPGPKDTRGPNLYGVIGRIAGTAPGYRGYSPSLKSYHDVWTPALLEQYLVHPAGFLREKLQDPKAQSRMNVRVKDSKARKDIVAYLAERSDGWSTK
ncbi:MAG: c-type cytochrome [Methylocystaceae bacterium]|nr:c-type cytochrome [Methylocystaceae bacterium]